MREGFAILEEEIKTIPSDSGSKLSWHPKGASPSKVALRNNAVIYKRF